MGWLERLAGVIRNSDQKNLQLLSLETYRLLVDLVMYISCIQKSDPDVNTKVFDMIVSHLAGAVPVPGILALRAGFSAQAKDSLAHLNSDIKEEVTRQNANNEIQPKTNYTRLLKSLLEL